MKLYVCLIFFCVLYFSSVKASITKNYHALLLVEAKDGDIALEQKNLDMPEEMISQYLFACPMKDKSSEFNDKMRKAKTNNSLFITQIDDLNKLQTCTNPVTPSVLQRAENFYTIGFEVYVREKDELCKERSSKLMEPAFCWFFVVNIKFTPDLKTLFVFHVLSKKSHERPEIESPDMNLGKELIFKNKDMEPLYSIENQTTVFAKIFPNSEERLQYFDPSTGKYLEKQFLAEPENFYYELHRDATFTYANIAPMWRSIKMGVWKQLSEMLRNLVYDNDYFLILVGSYGTLKLSKEIFLAEDNKMPVPLAFWKFVRFMQHIMEGDRIVDVLYHEIFIIIHNNPYDNDPKMICPKVADKYGWSKINSENSETGFTYCCEASEEMMEKFDVNFYLSRRTDYRERVVFNLQEYEKGNFINSK